LSESTNSPGAAAPDPAIIAVCRAMMLRRLKASSTDKLRSALSDTDKDHLAMVLLMASIILEYRELFTPKIVSLSRRVLRVNSITTTPGAQLPDWIHQAIMEREAAGARQDLAVRLEPNIAQLNDPKIRQGILARLLLANGDLVCTAIETFTRTDPSMAVGVASVVLEHLFWFNEEQHGMAIATLERFGQSTEPGAPLRVSSELIDAESATSMQSDRIQVVIIRTRVDPRLN